VMGTPAGAMGVNATWSLAKDTDGERVSGWRASANYSYNLLATGTNFALAGYRYSTRGYREMADALGALAVRAQGQPWTSQTWMLRSQATANVNQSLGRYGQLFLSAAVSDYYGGRSRDTQLQFAYNNSWRHVSYGLSFARQRTGTIGTTATPASALALTGARMTNVVMLTVALPLGSGPRAASLSAGVMHGSDRTGNYQASVSGLADAAQSMSYGISASHDAQGSSTSLAASLQKRLDVATLGASYSVGAGFWQASASARGAAVAHAGGVTPGPYLGDTFALVEAPGARGATVRNGMGAQVDRFGYALVPSLMPYRYNDIALDSRGMNRHAELDGNQHRVAPYAGAAVRLRFAVRRGQAVLVKSALPDGKPLPLGARVLDDTGAAIGMVGQGGQVYARIADPEGSLTVSWGSSRQDRCQIGYDLNGRDPDAALHRLESPCLPPMRLVQSDEQESGETTE